MGRVWSGNASLRIKTAITSIAVVGMTAIAGGSPIELFARLYLVLVFPFDLGRRAPDRPFVSELAIFDSSGPISEEEPMEHLRQRDSEFSIISRLKHRCVRPWNISMTK